MNKPDRWVVVKITAKDADPIYKVLGSWYGGYLGENSWKLNSGISEVKDNEHHISFHGYSGSVYECNKYSYGMSALSSGVLSGMIDHAETIDATIEVMPEDTNWIDLL